MSGLLALLAYRLVDLESIVGMEDLLGLRDLETGVQTIPRVHE